MDYLQELKEKSQSRVYKINRKGFNGAKNIG